MNAETRLRQMLDDPCTPFWLADVIRTALTKDAVDAACGLQAVAYLFAQRTREILRSAR